MLFHLPKNPQPVVKNKPPLTDDDILAEAFADVKPLAGGAGAALNPTPPPLQGGRGNLPHASPQDGTTTPSALQREIAAKAQLYQDIQLQKNMPTPDLMVVHDASAQRLAGARPGVDIRRLQRGYPAPEATIDLHGHTVQEAWVTLGQFLQWAHRRGLRCVLVIHGKGDTTPAGVGGIKQNIGRWLGLMPMVLGYHSAQPAHGGSGALYVLLKRH